MPVSIRRRKLDPPNPSFNDGLNVFEMVKGRSSPPKDADRGTRDSITQPMSIITPTACCDKCCKCVRRNPPSCSIVHCQVCCCRKRCGSVSRRHRVLILAIRPIASVHSFQNTGSGKTQNQRLEMGETSFTIQKILRDRHRDPPEPSPQEISDSGN